MRRLDDGIRYNDSDTGFRSKEVESKVQRQLSISRIDEHYLFDVLHNKEFYKIYEENKREGIRSFFSCMRCGIIPKSKIDRNNKIYLDFHCKCGNPVSMEDISDEEIFRMEEDRKYSDAYFRQYEREQEEEERKKGKSEKKECFFTLCVDEKTTTCCKDGNFDFYGFPVNECPESGSCEKIKEINNKTER